MRAEWRGKRRCFGWRGADHELYSTSGGRPSPPLRPVVVAGDDHLAAVPFDPPLYLDLVIAWKRGAHLSRANRAFVDFLLERTAGYGRG